MKPFLVLIILHATEDERKSGQTGRILGGLQVILAGDGNAAALKAGSKIGEFGLNDMELDRVEVAVRPF